jgi:RNA polymerase sigma factor (sigma-70 family)
LNNLDNPIHLSVDHLFRRRAGQMIAVLSRLFGAERLDQIEDAVQTAMVRALRQWPFQGTPDNPTAWLIQVAKNDLLDRLRRDARWRGEENEIDAAIDRLSTKGDEAAARFSREVHDDQLRLLFLSCHPLLMEEAQVALALKTIGGFSVPEIARAFLTRESTVARSLTRAKQRLREHHARFETPPPDKLPQRLDAVLKVLYLMFNEGYSASDGESLVRLDLCQEAIRLAELLADHPVTGVPRVHALVALFLFQGARLPARTDARGELLLLADQDRSKWNQAFLKRGLTALKRSASGAELSDYHLEAEIAACHSLAPSFEATDWARVLKCYEDLLARKASPIIELNRTIAYSRVYGAQAGLAELEKLRGNRLLQNYYPFYAALAELLRELGEWARAIEAYEQAMTLTSSQPARQFLRRRIESL